MDNAATHLLNTPDEPAKRAHGMAKIDATTTCSTAAHAAADAAGIIREWGQVYTLAATDCCCCGTPLRDAVSVTKGIGPICSQQHYELDFPITQDMVEEALGLLHASALEAPVKLAAKALKTKPRDLCNVLIWWASAHLDNAEVVLDCASVVTALGFDSLGDRLRERNTNVIITKVEGTTDFVLRCRSRHNVVDNMRRVKEASSVAREGRFKYGWRFPAERKDLVWAILGEDFGNEWATVPGKVENGPSQVVKIPAQTWFTVREAFRKAYEPPKPVDAPKPLIVRPGQNGTVEIHTPHRNFGFVEALKAAIPYNRGAGYAWNLDKGCWIVNAHFEAKVRELVAAHFDGAK